MLLQFPPEIVARVLHALLVSIFYDRPDNWFDARHALLSVSVEWRDFVSSLPIMWTHFMLTTRTTLDQCDYVLSKTKTSPIFLVVHLVSGPSTRLRDLWPLLEPLYARCVFIAAQADSHYLSEAMLHHFSKAKAPALHTLLLRVAPRNLPTSPPSISYFAPAPVPTIFGGNLPLLRNYSLHRCFIVWITPPSYSWLIQLVIGNQSPSTLASAVDWSAFLISMPVLTSLDLTHVSCVEEPFPSDPPSLPRLRYLRLRGGKKPFYRLLAAMHLPLLETFVYKPTLLDDLQVFLLAAVCLLESAASVALHTYRLGLAFHVRDMLFLVIRNVRRIDLRDVQDRDVACFFAKASAGRFPHLEWLYALHSSPLDLDLASFFLGCGSSPDKIVHTVLPDDPDTTYADAFMEFYSTSSPASYLQRPFTSTVNFWEERYN
ncbi:hypothetical protein K438DRAFT_1979099 [Mycena galopus ATCC 62051]|nr:hypothetical protein K438DRAFT_1979099 [Mycena galopus ATCC 62051]